MQRLREARAKLAAAENVDPWRHTLERVRGKIGDDGIERVTTQLLFDILEVPQRSRGPGVPSLGEANGPTWVDRCTGSGAHTRRLSGTGSRVLRGPLRDARLARPVHRPRGFGSADQF